CTSTMGPLQFALLLLLFHISVQQVHGLVLLTIHLRPFADLEWNRYIVCLQPNNSTIGDECIVNYTTWTFDADKLHRPRGGHDHQIIDLPWEEEMFLKIRATKPRPKIFNWTFRDSKSEQVAFLNVTELTAKHGTLRTGTKDGAKVFGSLDVFFSLSCVRGFIAANCSIGCNAARAICNKDTGEYTCHDGWTGEYCKYPYCMNNGNYFEGNCTCLPYWTGARCNLIESHDDCVIRGACPGLNLTSESHDDCVRRSACHELPRLTSLHFTMILFISLIILIIVTNVLMLLRRSRTLRKPIVTDSMKSSHYSLSIDESERS
ncbi:hypothetical protein PENTCL1PPCAC_194, partial [Pristionchus entomophagus]